jgi:pimeloyl-ACP methyl ester carboxylesterase
MDEIRMVRAGDGVPLGYRIDRPGRDAPSLVLLHGLASNSSRWNELVRDSALRGAWNLIRPDLRGHGMSLWRGRYTRATWCDDLLRLLDAERVDEAVVLGHSLGAQVAMDFALSESRRLRGLILVDPVFPDLLQGPLGWARRLRPLLWLAARLVLGVNRLGLRRRKLPELDLEVLDRQVRRALESDTAERVANFYMNPWTDLRYLPTANLLQDLFEVTRPVPEPAAIACPVHVLLAGGPAISTGAAMRQRIDCFPNQTSHVIDADHWLLTERPLEARQAIEASCAALWPLSNEGEEAK